MADVGLLEFWLHTVQLLLLTEQAGIEVTLKVCIEEVPMKSSKLKMAKS